MIQIPSIRIPYTLYPYTFYPYTRIPAYLQQKSYNEHINESYIIQIIRPKNGDLYQFVNILLN
jgi:hypothetical protein